MDYSKFNPNSVGINNGNFIGLPFKESDAQIILLGATWDLTVSYGAGTASAPSNILAASTQLDLYDPFLKDAWKIGLYFKELPDKVFQKNQLLRQKADSYIEFLENGGSLEETVEMKRILTKINQACAYFHEYIYKESLAILASNKLLGLIGGDHACPYGYIQALLEQHHSFGILQIDAHLDLRRAYEDFTYSHASIFYNVLQLEGIEKLVAVGIRDYCEEEIHFIEKNTAKIDVFYDHYLKAQAFQGESFHSLCEEIILRLPQKVYISFDIDGLDPKLCPNTGTPVPGGLQFEEAIYLIQQVVASGRTIIGFDVCEVAGHPHEWDANVGARICYKLANCMAKSNHLKTLF